MGRFGDSIFAIFILISGQVKPKKLQWQLFFWLLKSPVS